LPGKAAAVPRRPVLAIGMSTRNDPCPPAARCVDDLLDAVEQVAAPTHAQSAGEVTQWLLGLRDDPDRLGVLDNARRKGVDLPRLLVACAVYLGWRGWMDELLGALRIGPLVITPDCVEDINDTLAKAEAVGRSLRRPSADAAEARWIKSVIDDLDDEVRGSKGKVRTSPVPDGHGGVTERKWIALGGGVAITTATLGPAHAGLKARTGAPGDPALDVLMLVVVGHIWMVTGEPRVLFAADLLVRGLGIGIGGPRGGPADPMNAMRARGHHGLGDGRQPHRERARFIARRIGLLLRLE
jgi:hypothetical protein